MYYSVFYGCGGLFHKTQDKLMRFVTNYSKTIGFLALVCFSSIIFNYDLYHCDDNLIPITLRWIAGFSGNVVLLWITNQYIEFFEKVRLNKIGLYTLEMYTTHMYVNGLMSAGNTSGFFTVPGFANFAISLILTTIFTTILIMVIKSVPVANFILYGKSK